MLFSKMPEREDDHLTPATRLLEKRREMSEVEQALAAQKEVRESLDSILNFGFANIELIDIKSMIFCCTSENYFIVQLQEFQMKMESLQQRREELERKEYQLKESLLKFDKFLKVNSDGGDLY